MIGCKSVPESAGVNTIGFERWYVPSRTSTVTGFGTFSLNSRTALCARWSVANGSACVPGLLSSPLGATYRFGEIIDVSNFSAEQLALRHKTIRILNKKFDITVL